MNVPFDAESMYSILLPGQIARLHLAHLQKRGKQPTVRGLARVAGVSREAARRALRRDIGGAESHLQYD